MSNSLLSIGMTALDAAQAGLTTTSQNIANANTAGYAREAVTQTEALPVFSGGGYVGQGVSVVGVQRIVSSFNQQELVQSQAGASQLDTYYTQIQQVDNILGNSSSGLSTQMNTFFSSAQAVASNPSDVPTRQSMLGSLQTLVAGFNSTAAQVQQISAGVNQTIQGDVTSVNTLAGQIAQLNQSIAGAGGATGGKPPNDLLDQRDQLMNQLNQLVGTTALTQSDGTINVFVGNGQPLVLGNTVNTMTTVPDSQNPSQLQLALKSGSANLLLSNSQLQGGALTGLMNFRDQTLIPTQNSLGQIALNLSSAINSQNQLGQDLNGALGGPLLSTSGAQVVGAPGNSSSAGISVATASASQLTTSDYQLKYDGSKYTLTRLSDNTSFTYASLPQTVDGMTITQTGTMAAGDSFAISPTANGASSLALATTDPAKIAAASPVRASPATTNSGDVVVTALAATPPPPTNSNLQNSVNVNFQVSGGTTTYSLVDPTSGTVLQAATPFTSGSPISFNGWQMTLSGTPANGDTVSVSSNVNGKTDNTNALALANLQTAPQVNGQSLSAMYQQLADSVGSTTQQLKATSSAQDSLLTEAQNAVSTVSGVNLNDEAANLLKFQQAFQAASQTIVAAKTMFDTILQVAQAA